MAKSKGVVESGDPAKFLQELIGFMEQKYEFSHHSTSANRKLDAKDLFVDHSRIIEAIEGKSENVVLRGVRGSGKSLAFIVVCDEMCRRGGGKKLGIVVNCRALAVKARDTLRQISESGDELTSSIASIVLTFHLTKFLLLGAKQFCLRAATLKGGIQNLTQGLMESVNLVADVDTAHQLLVEGFQKGLSLGLGRTTTREKYTSSEKDQRHLGAEGQAQAEIKGNLGFIKPSAKLSLKIDGGGARETETERSGETAQHILQLREENDQIIEMFQAKLEDTNIEDVYLFFDDFSEVPWDIKSAFNDALGRLLMTMRTKARVSYKVRLSVYPGDESFRGPIGVRDSFKPVDADLFSHNISSTVVAGYSPSEKRGGNTIQAIIDKVHQITPCDLGRVFVVGKDREAFFRNLYMLGGGSMRRLAQLLASQLEHEFPISIQKLQELGEGFWAEQIRQITYTGDAMYDDDEWPEFDKVERQEFQAFVETINSSIKNFHSGALDKTAMINDRLFVVPPETLGRLSKIMSTGIAFPHGRMVDRKSGIDCCVISLAASYYPLTIEATGAQTFAADRVTPALAFARENLAFLAA